MAKPSLPQYPNVRVRLVGEDGNAFAIMGRVSRAMRRAGLSEAEVACYMREAMSSGSYDELLAVTLRTVDCWDDGTIGGGA